MAKQKLKEKNVLLRAALKLTQVVRKKSNSSRLPMVGNCTPFELVIRESSKERITEQLNAYEMFDF